ncbi:MAG: EAL domain-containing protein [Prochlorotrichaceae cyanobacterium]|jgi:two-component system CheB/CheR fusion protein
MIANQNPSLEGFSFVVGIGASAGGLKPLQVFFSSLPPNPGAAFVVIQHLSPQLPNWMVDLLQQQTTLPVCLGEYGMALELDHIYLLPPGERMWLHQGQLFLEKSQGHDPIDYFLISLAQEQNERCMAILLSGTGEDGTAGVKAISRAGGIVLVQSSETAQFGTMPGNPVSLGLVDEILSPEELARVVYDILQYTTQTQTIFQPNEDLLSPAERICILDLLQKQENINFSQYKIGTLKRRILHRQLLSSANTISDYIIYLSERPEEVKQLCQDLLIGATRFFRDSEFWSVLQQDVLPALLERLQPEQPLRFWVAACSTGEEAYSLAIAIHEVMQALGRSHPVKLFATDVDQEALGIASHGLYFETIAHDLSPERLERYFTLEGKDYRIKKFIRTQIIFASQDLTTNPGFSHMHLVTCRNVLIYMQPPLQEQVLRLLHFSLIPEGILVLGSSEHLGSLSDAFTTLNPPWKIFQKRKDIQVPFGRTIYSPTVNPIAKGRSDRFNPLPYEHLLSAALKLRFGDCPTTCLLINQNHRVIHILINTARLLDFPLGEINTDILDLVLPSLKIPLSTALHRAKRSQETVLYSNIRLTELPLNRRLNLWVSKVDIPIGKTGVQLMVLLEVITIAESIEGQVFQYDPNSDLSQHVQELEFDLQQTRENLQASIEELETANEEQQASNEELLASNEELQSTNEELQSVNEELSTLNAENQKRIQELTELSADIDNLLQSTDLGVVFLDQSLNIRKVTPAASEVFHFRSADIGRPLEELMNDLDLDNLMDFIRRVATHHTLEEVEATNLKNGDRLLLRILPYKGAEGIADGIVITLITINDLKQIQDVLEQTNTLLEEIYRNSPLGLALIDQDLRFLRLNQPLANIHGLSIEDHLGKSLPDLLPDLYFLIQSHLSQVFSQGDPVTFELTSPYLQSSLEQTWLFSLYPVPLETNHVGIGVIVTDITRIKENEAELQRLTQRLTQAQKIAHIGDWEYDAAQGAFTWSDEMFRIMGCDPNEGIPSIPELMTMVHPNDRGLLTNLLDSDFSEKDNFEIDLLIYPQGSPTERFIKVLGRIVSNASTHIYGTVMDITMRRQAEANLEHQAFFDPLTQLPNRAFFLQHLKLAIGRVSRDTSCQFAVLYLDLDRFKEINDTLGHAAGDQLLEAIARRIENVLRPGDIVSRLGGDEFVVLLEKTSHPELALEVAHRIQSVISEPLLLASTQISATSSIGIAFYDPDDAWKSETAVLENADIAMYQAKAKGLGNVALFNASMRTQRLDQMILKTEIVQGLEQNEFVLFYQPLINLNSSALAGFEVLVRWQHPQRGLLIPINFLPMTQSAGLMPGLESWVLKQACWQCRQWQQQFELNTAFQININISSIFLKHSNFLHNLDFALSDSGVNPRHICLEITENAFIDRYSQVDTILQSVKRFGLQLALDDFGTGYSSLSYLHQLPIDIVKIDQSFVQCIQAESSAVKMTQGIVSLARQLELEVIAEGIETERQRQFMRSLSCDYGQGYLFSHPVVVAEAEQFIQNPCTLKL